VDELKKIALIRKVRRIEHGSPRGRDVLISLQDYFDGNDESDCTILANTDVRLPAQAVARRLSHVEAREDVSGCWIRLYDYDDALDFADAWVNSDTVYVVSSASVDAISSWFASLAPSDVREVDDLQVFANPPVIPAGHRMVAVWWD
jgi:hypothetical protein